MEVEVYQLLRLSWCSLIFTNTKTLQLYRSLKKTSVMLSWMWAFIMLINILANCFSSPCSKMIKFEQKGKMISSNSVDL